MALSKEETSALIALVRDPHGWPKWGDADYIVVCRSCGGAAICCTKIGIPACVCGGEVMKVPHMEALLAAFRIGGWQALIEACKAILADAKDAG